LLGWSLSNEQVPQRFAEMLIAGTASKWQILLLINFMLFALGMFIDSIPAIMIVIPFFLNHVNPVIVSEIFIINKQGEM